MDPATYDYPWSPRISVANSEGLYEIPQNFESGGRSTLQKISNSKPGAGRAAARTEVERLVSCFGLYSTKNCVAPATATAACAAPVTSTAFTSPASSVCACQHTNNPPQSKRALGRQM